jgi:phosphoenolpyruvate carboxykinase (ATP)
MKTTPLDLKGLTQTGPIHRNLAVAQLVEMSLRRGESTLASNGALVALTGNRTGRSPADKFIVREPSSESRIAWGPVNQTMDLEHFQGLHHRLIDYFNGRDVFVFDGFAGADPAHRLPLRIITEKAWHSLFARQLFRRPLAEEIAAHQPQFTFIIAPKCLAAGKHDGIKSEAFIALNFAAGLGLIGGMRYAGEIKKAVFTVMNYLMPLQGVFPMHCSANVGAGGDVALFFGLSGTGKTSLSADPERQLIGDDEHGWGEHGVFNIEGGCYAKCIRLNRDREPQIWNAIRFGAMVENVVVNPATREVDYDDDSITENTRAAYPIDFIANAVNAGTAGHPRSIIFLAADAFGILPPVARLTETQLIYHFLSGYTARLAGTEAGMGREPEATFSTCFGAPFLPLPPRVYADLLAKKIREHRCRCYLVNTGWVGGPFGVGERIRLQYSRAIIREIQSGRLDDAPALRDPVFGFDVPQHCGEVPAEMLQPRGSWKQPNRYDAQARDLARRFLKNFEPYAASAPDIAAAGPKV